MENLEASDKVKGILPLTDEELEELSMLKEKIYLSIDDKDEARDSFQVHAGYLQANLPKIYWDIWFGNFKGDKSILEIIKKYMGQI